jgi:hypothetical protein
MPMNQPFFLRVNLHPYENRTIIAKCVLNTTSFTMEADAFPQIELQLTALDIQMQKGEKR